MSNKVYIIDAKRSPIGSFMGSLSHIKSADLLGVIIKELIDNNCDIKNEIDEVIVGSVLSCGQGQGVARQASLNAGLGIEVPAYSINMVCGSGMKSVMMAYTQIKYGVSNVIISGGVEIMSQAPFINNNMREGNKLGNLELVDTLIQDGLTCGVNNYHMGITAENLTQKYNISRKKQDEFAFKSQQKAINAIDSNRFYDEIVSVEINNGSNSFIFDKDEYPNRNTSMDKLSKLRSVFKKDGTVTAGNSSGINDGASAMIIVSEEIVNKYNLTPLAEIIDIAQGGVDPKVMGIGPVIAIQKLMNKVDISFNDIDLFEVNEAFAVQALAVIEELKKIYEVDDNFFNERLNLNGGSIALGHPLGSSGNRIITTLCHEIKKSKLDYGIASLCIGGGMGTAILIKKV